MKQFLKDNFKDKYSFLLLFILACFFLPSIKYSIRTELIVIYSLSAYFFFKYFFNKKFYENFLNSFNIIFLGFLILYGAAILASITYNFFSTEFNIINNKFPLLKFLSSTDNFVQPIAIIIVSIFFIRYNENKSYINLFFFIIVILAGLNGLYAFLEVKIFQSDGCGIVYSPKQSIFCDIIAYLDLLYAGEQFSFALDERIIDLEAVNANLKIDNKELLSLSDKAAILQEITKNFNSTTVGWLSLSSGRSSGIFAMPIQAGLFHSCAIFIFFFFYKKNYEYFLNYKFFNIFIIIIFNFILVGAVLSVSKVFSFITLFLLVLNFFIFKKNIKILSRSFLIGILLFTITLSSLYQSKWEGFNLYLGHYKKLFLVVNNFGGFYNAQNLSESNNFFKKFLDFKLFRDTTPIKDGSKELLENFETGLKKFEAEVISENLRTNQINKITKTYLKKYYLKNNDELNNSIFETEVKKYKKLNFYFNYVTGNRYKSIPQEITILMYTNPLIGFGTFYSIGYDQTLFYLLFYIGIFGLCTFAFILITIFFKILSFSKHDKFFSFLMLNIFFLFLISSLGAPVYFMNRIIIIFYFLVSVLFFNKTNQNAI